jgi:hypothetical protein
METVLFKLKSGVTPDQLSDFLTRAKALVGQIPGLVKLEVNKPLASTAHRGQGFNMGLVAILERAEDVQVYAEHPAHLAYVRRLLSRHDAVADDHGSIHNIRMAISDDTLAYDLEYAD